MTVSTLCLILTLFLTMAPSGSSDQVDRIALEERKALSALYNATGGSNWIHKDGWLGPPGSECHWYGVVCGKGVGGQLTVQDLNLPDNGLTGYIPEELGSLNGLRRLTLGANTVKAPLPYSLLQRFDEGRLEIDPLSLTHDVEEVAFDFNNPAILCSGYKARITADGSVHFERRLCPEYDKQASKLNCEQRDGRTYDFDMLGRYLIRNRFFSEVEDPTIFRGSDILQVTVTAKRRSTAPVSRTWTGTTSLSNWSLSLILEGLIARTQWRAPSSKTICSQAGGANESPSRVLGAADAGAECAGSEWLSCWSIALFGAFFSAE